MKRLTMWIDDGENRQAIPDPEIRSNGHGKCCNKLAEYEDLEEQGRLLRLPCKVGDTVYVIHYIDRRYVICSHVISKFVIMPYRFPRVQIYFEKENGFITSDFEGQVNENLFFTKEEAEAKLKEMEGSHEF